jgi:hypothetical protein
MVWAQWKFAQSYSLGLLAVGTEPAPTYSAKVTARGLLDAREQRGQAVAKWVSRALQTHHQRGSKRLLPAGAEFGLRLFLHRVARGEVPYSAPPKRLTPENITLSSSRTFTLAPPKMAKIISSAPSGA